MFDKLMNVLKEAAMAVPQTTPQPKPEVSLTEEFKEFPMYSGTILEGPKTDITPKYKRISYRVDGGIEEYKALIQQQGFTQKSKVRFDSPYSDSYIIIERKRKGYKIAFHKKEAGN